MKAYSRAVRSIYCFIRDCCDGDLMAQPFNLFSWFFFSFNRFIGDIGCLPNLWLSMWIDEIFLSICFLILHKLFPEWMPFENDQTNRLCTHKHERAWNVGGSFEYLMQKTSWRLNDDPLPFDKPNMNPPTERPTKKVWN